MSAHKLTCEHCESEIDPAKDPRCVVYDPSGATDVICEVCRERLWGRWAAEQFEIMKGTSLRQAAGCGDLNEPFRIKRGW
jgi:hypothetical protein